jgi:hypothetical protein
MSTKDKIKVKLITYNNFITLHVRYFDAPI